MKHTSLMKAVQKTGVKIKSRNGWYSATTKYKKIKWFFPKYELDRAICLRVIGINDKDDPRDYHTGGNFFNTIKSAIEDFTCIPKDGEN